ncbi:MAG: FAD-dependent monooxygenase [Rhizobiaceae bacterium]|nr:FAD-dependent monooxygenase [Rhizobiaceae bacterium]
MSRRVQIAGAGIAGLTIALFLARAGFDVEIRERAQSLESVGAGLQLSPNATRLLDRLGLLPAIETASVAPQAIELRDARSLKPLAAVALGDFASRRWGAPYLVIHRGDLQRILLDAAIQEPQIGIRFGTQIDASAAADLTIGADGVWSTMRSRIAGASPTRFSGHVAWRALVDVGDPAFTGLAASLSPTSVTALLAPSFHLVAYPIRGGRALNLVAIMRGNAGADDWSQSVADAVPLPGDHAGTLRDLLAPVRGWTRWPLHDVDPSGKWGDAGGFLVGDAAHAMTPYAAQGAAMAIEDGAALAAALGTTPDIASALARYEAVRRSRLARVAGRARFNRFAWHAAGPVALARNLVLKTRTPERLAADFDWLYGFDAAAL